jgi:hypothetical protein
MFTASALHSNEQKKFKSLGEILGTHWDRETVEAMFASPKKGKTKPVDEIVIPLLLGSNPKIQDYLRKRFGRLKGIKPPSWYENVNRSEVVEGYDMDRDKFINLAGMFTPLIPQNYLEKLGYGR